MCWQLISQQVNRRQSESSLSRQGDRVAEILKRQFSGLDLSKLEAGLYDMKVAKGTDEYLARFVGWESRKTFAPGADAQEQQLALFAVRTDQGEQLRKLVFLASNKLDDIRRLKLLFTLVFSTRESQVSEWVPTARELEMVK